MKTNRLYETKNFEFRKIVRKFFRTTDWNNENYRNSCNQQEIKRSNKKLKKARLYAVNERNAVVVG